MHIPRVIMSYFVRIIDSIIMVILCDIVFPELNTIVIFTGGNYTSKTTNFKILEKYILPAIE